MVKIMTKKKQKTKSMMYHLTAHYSSQIQTTQISTILIGICFTYCQLCRVIYTRTLKYALILSLFFFEQIFPVSCIYRWLRLTLVDE